MFYQKKLGASSNGRSPAFQSHANHFKTSATSACSNSTTKVEACLTLSIPKGLKGSSRQHYHRILFGKSTTMPPRSTNRRNAPQSPPKQVVQTARSPTARRSARSQSHDAATDSITVQIATRGNKRGQQPDKSGKYTHARRRNNSTIACSPANLRTSSCRHRRISNRATKHIRARCGVRGWRF